MISATSRASAGLTGAFFATMALSCGKAETPATASAEPAGKVEAVEGQVTAVRSAGGSVARQLAVANAVFADDTVTTALGASVAIRLAHNAALWRLEGGLAKRVDQSAAWKAPKDAAPQAVAQRAEPVQTASAGRHSAHEAAGTAESAVRAEPASAPAAPPEPGPAAPAPTVAAPAPARVPDAPPEERQAKSSPPRRPASAAPRPGGRLRGDRVDDSADLGLGSDRAHGAGGGATGGAAPGLGGAATGSSSRNESARTYKLFLQVASEDAALKATLSRLLAQRRAALTRCVEQASRADVATPSKWVVRVEVGGAGAVTVVAVDGAPEPLKACVRAVFAVLRGLPDTNPAAEVEVTVRVQ
ncbi:MAG: hypothetical protein FJ100_16915 [Deltaproteobacteria bacterium]|nr:hypothetical protein [Deltaproteobacteria bacterium]